MGSEIRILDDLAKNIRESRAAMDELSVYGVSLGMSQEQIDIEVREALTAYIDKVINTKMKEMLGA